MSSRLLTMSEMSHSGGDSSLRLRPSYPDGGPGGPPPSNPHAHAPHRPDLLISPLTASALEEARVLGWGTRSIDLGSIPTIDGRVLYQLRALLFARPQLVSLAIPALPDSSQVYRGVSIPSLVELTIRCALAEERDVAGAVQAFADAPAHTRIATFRLDSACALPRSLGRLGGNPRLRTFLAGVRFFSLSGRDDPRAGESGLRRALFRFASAMPHLRKFEYGGYVPGLPAFQAVRAVLHSSRELAELTVAQGAPASSAREDAHLHASLCALPPGSPLLLDLHLRAALGASEVAALAGGPAAPGGPRIRRLDLTMTPRALRALAAVCRVNAASLRDLRVSVLPADDAETPALWAAFADAVAEAGLLDTVHFACALPRPAHRAAAARVLQEARAAVEVRIHAPGAAPSSEDAREAYITALRAAEGCARLRRLWLCVSDGGPIGDDVEKAKASFVRKAGVPVAVEIGKGLPGDGDYEEVKLLNPNATGFLWPIAFLLTPWLSDLVIALVVAVILTIIGVGAVGISFVANKNLRKGTPKP